MSDLPEEMVEEILSRVPLKSQRAVRRTCKPWNALTRKRKQFTGFMVIDSKLCSMEFNLDFQRFPDGDFLVKQVNTFNIAKSKIFTGHVWGLDGLSNVFHPFIEQAHRPNHADAEICEVFHWDGLIFCVIKDDSWRFVWNPYLCQIKWFQNIDFFHRFDSSDMYAVGYEDKNNNRNHKILRLLRDSYEIYDFNSDSWRILHLNPGCNIRSGCVSLKGNAYFLGREAGKSTDGLLCFDFTAERFGTLLALPFGSSQKTISCVRDEKLAVSHHTMEFSLEIWITTKIEVNIAASSWSRFLRLEFHPVVADMCFFIDEDKKIALVSGSGHFFQGSIIGVDGYFRTVKIREARQPLEYCYNQLVFSSYAPSLVELQPYCPGSKISDS
ncbi:unnamed protein product [Microthlaspi erraticum]|uniref:F-box domain-containing protein n=1 Tax=Microthlaspi erraticum TaxID=1685480 RepID=A0A6D2HMU4_9BRAS|nr:unnamed protein product [Microthlaspi erraticum]